jgi:lipoyl(octanoyl) transferase
MRLPITIEVILFKKNGNRFKFLLLKRIPSRGGFWQFLTGGLEDKDKSHLDCAFRELKEELNLSKNSVKRIIDSMPHFEFDSEFNGKKTGFREYVFGFEIDKNKKINLDNDEHEEMRWCSEEECLKLLYFENNKMALKNLIKKLSKASKV